MSLFKKKKEEVNEIVLVSCSDCVNRLTVEVDCSKCKKMGGTEDLYTPKYCMNGQ